VLVMVLEIEEVLVVLARILATALVRTTVVNRGMVVNEYFDLHDCTKLVFFLSL